ncbi:MAG: hypothetical protein ABIQ40_14010 [Bacteroidia bacterium]
MKNLLAFIFISLFALAGCKDDEPITVPADGVRVLLFVNHHGVAISHARVFVKNNTVSFPGTDTTLYDTRYVTDVNGRLTLTGIPNGQQAYTYYAKGIDASWDSTGTTPVWGYQFVITDTHTGETKDYSIAINVSE